jgi:putative tricarboxylic transport membrane protein
MVELPKGILIPIIIVLSVVGTYTIQNNIVDVYWMLGFGIFGYFLKLYGFQVGPVILGVILGPLMDVSYRRALMSCKNDFGLVAQELFTNPISLILSLAVIWMLVSQTPLWRNIKRRFGKKKAAPSG